MCCAVLSSVVRRRFASRELSEATEIDDDEGICTFALLTNSSLIFALKPSAKLSRKSPRVEEGHPRKPTGYTTMSRSSSERYIASNKATSWCR
jgi:hypothetical protein